MVMELEIGIFQLFAEIVPSVVSGRGALETYCISSPRECYFFALAKLLPESGVQIAHHAPNTRLTTSPSGIAASLPRVHGSTDEDGGAEESVSKMKRWRTEPRVFTGVC